MDSVARMGCLQHGDDEEEARRDEYLALCLVMLAHGVRDEVIKVDSAAKMYSCSVCGKVYSCYKALGGHKRKHRNPSTATASSARIGRDQLKKMHQCLICLRSFPSGQALGGHKRMHYDGGVTAKRIEAPATSTVSLNSFDLNQLPATSA